MTRLSLLLLAPILLLGQRADFTVTNSRLISSVEPEYSEQARQAGLQGTVSLYAEIDTKGEPTKIQVLHGLGMGLDEKAIQSAQQWRFRPNLKNGYPVRLGQSIDIDFHLDGDNSWRIRLAATSLKVAQTKATDAKTNQTQTTPAQTWAMQNDSTILPTLISYTAPDAAGCPEAGGNMMASVEIGADGKPSSVSMERVNDPMTQPLAKAIYAWRYRPGSIAGVPAPATSMIEFE